MDVIMTGRLSVAGEETQGEWVAIRNLSIHGARVISEHAWREREHVNLGETVGDQQLDAEVVYCQPLRDGRYGVGLKFVSVQRLNSGLWAPQYRQDERPCAASA
jgi:hypothetical protein